MTRRVHPIKELPCGYDRSPHRGWVVRALGGRRYQCRKGFHPERCSGEAHRAPAHHDSCMLCAPLWGVIAVQDVEVQS